MGRGGGSFQDLWSFNEEIVVRSIYSSKIPIISAVGHETDTTLSDYVADYRAPTPSAAAELAAVNREEILQHLDHLQDSLLLLVNRTVQSYSEKVNTLKQRHGFFIPPMILENCKNKIAEISQQLKQNINKQIQSKINLIETISSKLELLNPQSHLKRGYALALDKHNQVIYTPDQVEIDEIFNLRIAEGQLQAKVLDKRNKND